MRNRPDICGGVFFNDVAAAENCASQVNAFSQFLIPAARWLYGAVQVAVSASMGEQRG
jgi:hypothetical protein